MTVMVAVLLAACAGTPHRPPTEAAVPIVNPPRSERGNPPFYEVFGRTYAVMESSNGYRESGIASWYGEDFHGNPTSSGEPYDMYAMTAAHKTLPLPTWVEVTNQRNGRSVIVKVNDRGPFVDDRLIDMSFAAAQELDMVTAGTVPVVVRALGAAATSPVADQAGTDMRGAVVTPPLIYVQVGAFSDASNAERLLTRLMEAGISAARVSTQSTGAGQMHRVRVGPLLSRDEFEPLNQRLLRLGLEGARIVFDQVTNN